VSIARKLPEYTSACPHCQQIAECNADNAVYWTCKCGAMFEYYAEMVPDGWIMWLEAEVDPNDPDVQARKHAYRFKK
jgi:hypothetical protein